MKNKKGQAAMEFLMTYGWAILAAVIAIGVLAYFGVFSPGKYAPTSCVLTSPLGCDEYKVSAGQVELVLRNGVGETANITGVTLDGCTADTGNYQLSNGATQLITLTCSGVSAGDRFRGDLAVDYIKSGGTLTLTSTGSVSGTAAA